MTDVHRIEAGLMAAFQRYKARVGPQVTILGGPQPNDHDLTPLMDAISHTEAFPAVNGWWIWARGRQNVLTAGWLATWAFPACRLEDQLQATAKEIYQVITTRAAPISLYTAIWGAETTEPADLDAQISIRPFGYHVSRAAEEFVKSGPGNPVRFLGAYRQAVGGPPTLMMRNRLNDFRSCPTTRTSRAPRRSV